MATKSSTLIPYKAPETIARAGIPETEAHATSPILISHEERARSSQPTKGGILGLPDLRSPTKVNSMEIDYLYLGESMLGIARYGLEAWDSESECDGFSVRGKDEKCFHGGAALDGRTLRSMGGVY